MDAGGGRGVDAPPAAVPDSDATAVATVAAPVLSAAEAAELGGALAEQGDFAGARDAFQYADDRGMPSVPPIWASCSNRKETSSGRQPRIAAQTGEAMPMGLYNLGGLLAQQGDVPGAVAAFRGPLNEATHRLRPVWGSCWNTTAISTERLPLTGKPARLVTLMVL